MEDVVTRLTDDGGLEIIITPKPDPVQDMEHIGKKVVVRAPLGVTVSEDGRYFRDGMEMINIKSGQFPDLLGYSCTLKRVDKKCGRNSYCLCGSRKKYKHCCLRKERGYD